MSKQYTAAFAICVSAGLCSIPMSPQAYLEPNYNNCIELTNGGLGTIAIRNTCNIKISVQWVPFDGSPGGRLLVINPGSSQGTGSTYREKQEAGGWDYYICPKDYTAVDARDRQITKPNTQFHCKKD